MRNVLKQKKMIEPVGQPVTSRRDIDLSVTDSEAEAESSSNSTTRSPESSLRDGTEQQSLSNDEINDQSDGLIRLTVQGLYNKSYPGAGPFSRFFKKFALTRLLLSEANKSTAGSGTDVEKNKSSVGSGIDSTWVCRQRIKTRPMQEPSSSEHEINNKRQDQSSSSANQGYETAMFVPGKGLIGGWFWHESDPFKKVIREDRAVLFQSEENYNRLQEHPMFASCFDGTNYIESPSFGEQIIVKGCQMSDLAIGDIFQVEGAAGSSSPSLVVEITAPRKPCYKMNKKHGTKGGSRGIQTYAHHHCLAGWFARVLVSGELRDGMTFIRTSHPNPKWTLPDTHKALYGEGTRLQSNMCSPSWNRSREELEELIALPQLGEYEWKAEARKLLLQMNGIDVKNVRPDLIDAHIDPVRVKMYRYAKEFYMSFSWGEQVMPLQMSLILFSSIYVIASAIFCFQEEQTRQRGLL